MAVLINKDESMMLLRNNRKHYLWLKPIRIWTAKDVENLRSGVNINYGNIMREKHNCNKQPIEVVTPEGEKIQCDSVVHASKVSNVKPQNIYAVVNGKYAQTHNFQFTKIACL